jgi:hypothetical protein
MLLERFFFSKKVYFVSKDKLRGMGRYIFYTQKNTYIIILPPEKTIQPTELGTY